MKEPGMVVPASNPRVEEEETEERLGLAGQLV